MDKIRNRIAAERKLIHVINANKMEAKTDPYAVVKYPLSTEKSIRLMNDQNKLMFVVNRKADKNDVKKAVEELFKAKVIDVKTVVTKGQKRAYVKFSNETPAIDIATNLGFM